MASCVLDFVRLFSQTMRSNASAPVMPGTIPSRSASMVTDSNGAANSCDSVRTPTARAAIICRSLSFSLSKPTSSAPHIIYPRLVLIESSVVFGSLTSTPISVCSPTVMGSIVTNSSTSFIHQPRCICMLHPLLMCSW